MLTPDITDDARTRVRILSSTVELLRDRNIAAVTVPVICAAADVSAAEFAEHFNTPSDVFVGIVGNLLDAHRSNESGRPERPRSLTESMQKAMRAVWTLMENHIDEHRALLVMMLAQANDPTLTEQMGFSVHRTYLNVAEAWLADVATVHGVSWELPVPQLAVLMQATVDGLLVDYLCTGDGDEIRMMLDVLAIQIAQHGRRRAKNQPY